MDILNIGFYLSVMLISDNRKVIRTLVRLTIIILNQCPAL